MLSQTLAVEKQRDRCRVAANHIIAASNPISLSTTIRWYSSLNPDTDKLPKLRTVTTVRFPKLYLQLPFRWLRWPLPLSATSKASCRVLCIDILECSLVDTLSSRRIAPLLYYAPTTYNHHESVRGCALFSKFPRKWNFLTEIHTPNATIRLVRFSDRRCLFVCSAFVWFYPQNAGTRTALKNVYYFTVLLLKYGILTFRVRCFLLLPQIRVLKPCYTHISKIYIAYERVCARARAYSKPNDPSLQLPISIKIYITRESWYIDRDPWWSVWKQCALWNTEILALINAALYQILVKLPRTISGTCKRLAPTLETLISASLTSVITFFFKYCGINDSETTSPQRYSTP